MGKRGPPPKPSALKLVEGTYRPDRVVPDEVQYTEGIPPCPKHLGPAAKAEWKRIAGELSKVPGLIQKVDMAALAAYCSSYAMWAHAETEMQKAGGLVVEYETKTGAVMSQQSAWVGIRNQALQTMLQYAQQFGFTPSSRTRVAAPGGGKKGETEADRLASKYLG